MTTEKKKTVVINCLIFLTVVLSALCMHFDLKVLDTEIKLKRCQLDKAGLKGLADALIDQKFKIPSNAFEYRPSLPDYQSIIVRVYYDEESPLNDHQIALIKQRHSIAIGEIDIIEWNSWEKNNGVY